MDRPGVLLGLLRIASSGELRREHRVPQLLQALPGQLQDGRLVLHHQHRLRPPARRRRLRFHPPGRGRPLDPRQVHLEGGPLPRLAVHVDEAVVLLDDPVDRGQPQPRALPRPLGREERLEQVRQRLLVHAAPVVAHRKQHVLSRHEARVSGAVRLVEA